MTDITNDTCRCHDSGCPERERCLRWILRDTGYEQTPHAGSLYPYDQPRGEECPSMIAEGGV
jgi:hypothetical protein